jgi:hypothetical protein
MRTFIQFHKDKSWHFKIIAIFIFIIFNVVIGFYGLRNAKYEGVTTALFVESSLDIGMASTIASQVGISLPSLNEGIFNYYNFSEVLLSRGIFENMLENDSVVFYKLKEAYRLNDAFEYKDKDSIIGLLYNKFSKDVRIEKLSKQSSVFLIEITSRDKNLIGSIPMALIDLTNEYFLNFSDKNSSVKIFEVKAKIDSVNEFINSSLFQVGFESDEKFTVTNTQRFQLQDRISRNLTANYALLGELKKQYELLTLSVNQDAKSDKILVLDTPKAPFHSRYWRVKVLLKSFILVLILFTTLSLALFLFDYFK